MGKKALGLVGTSMGLIALYLILTNWIGAREVLGAITGFYTSSVKVLQGR